MVIGMKVRRLIALILCVLLVISLFPISASALGETPIGYIECAYKNMDRETLLSSEGHQSYMDLIENHQDLITYIYESMEAKQEDIYI